MFNNKIEVTKVPAPAICPVSVKEEIEKVQKTYDDLIRRFFCTISHYNGYSVIDYNNFWARRFESYISMKEAEAKTRAERARIREIVKDIMTEIDIENKTENNVKTETKIDIKKTKAPSDHKDGLGRKWVLKEVNSENKGIIYLTSYEA